MRLARQRDDLLLVDAAALADDLRRSVDGEARSAAVLDALMGWEETAALTDPERMAAHTGGFDPDDYVEVLRPEVDTGDDQSAVSAPAPAA
jgi:hypothetical protein